jgi:hypothetical protein
MGRFILLLLAVGLSTHFMIQDEMKEGVLEIRHTKYGPEEFVISDPRYNIYQSEDGIWEFTIQFETEKCIKRAKEFADLIDAAPEFEATAILSPDSLELAQGRVITQKSGYDEEREEYLSNIYYFDHNTVEELEIRILEYRSDWLVLEVKGKALINGDNGFEPDAELLIYRTRFALDKELRRGIQ